MMQLFSLLVCLHILSHTLSEVHFNDEKKTPRVHCFYYLWYGTPEQDSAWKHWDHEVLPHWEDRINERFKETVGTRHDPPGRLHSPFYPQLGPYSSKDSTVIAAHFDMMQEAGINIAVVLVGPTNKPESTTSRGLHWSYSRRSLENLGWAWLWCQGSVPSWTLSRTYRGKHQTRLGVHLSNLWPS